MEPRRPPMANVGTETAVRRDECKHFRKCEHLLRSDVSWCDQTSIDLHMRPCTCLASQISTQKEPISTSESTPALYLDKLDADRLPNAADSLQSSLGHLITMVKLKRKNSFENEKNLNILGDLWEKLMNLLSTTHAKMPCKFAKVKSVTWEMSARGRWDAPTRKPCAYRVLVPVRWGEVTSNNRLWSP